MAMGKIFSGCIMTIFVLNVIWYFRAIDTDVATNFGYTLMIGFITSLCGVALVMGVTVLTVGLSGESIKFIIGLASMLCIMFAINLTSQIQFGLGLINNVYSLLGGGDFLSLGSFIVMVLSLATLTSGLVLIASSGD